MEKTGAYQITRQYRSTEWATERQEPSQAFLEIAPEGIRIALRTESENRVTALDEIRFTRPLDEAGRLLEFSHFVPQSILSQSSPGSLVLIPEAGAFTLCPKKLYIPGRERDLLEWSAPVAETDRVLPEELDAERVLLFAVDGGWWKWGEQIFTQSEIRWTHPVAGIFRSLTAEPPEQDRFLLARVLNQSVLLLGYRDGQWQFANRFACQTENDLLYYLLLACQETGLAPETDPVLLCGNILPGSAGFEKLRRYLGELSFRKAGDIPGSIPEEDWRSDSSFFDLICSLRFFPVK